MKWIFGILVVAFLTSWIVARVSAHGDASWIMNNIGLRPPATYVDKSGTHCCGPSDCERIDPQTRASIIIDTEDAVHVLGEYQQVFPKKTGQALYYSIDDDWWWCRRGGVVKCLFLPGRDKI